MGRAPCCDKSNVKRGPWSPEEDMKLKEFIDKYGTGGNWIALPHKAGLKRCGKSCRLRWLNYLRPNIKHGEFSDAEDRIICTLFATIGSRWSIIAGHLPGRTDNDIKNYWNTKLKKKILAATYSHPPIIKKKHQRQHQGLLPNINNNIQQQQHHPNANAPTSRFQTIPNCPPDPRLLPLPSLLHHNNNDTFYVSHTDVLLNSSNTLTTTTSPHHLFHSTHLFDHHHHHPTTKEEEDGGNCNTTAVGSGSFLEFGGGTALNDVGGVGVGDGGLINWQQQMQMMSFEGLLCSNGNFKENEKLMLLGNNDGDHDRRHHQILSDTIISCTSPSAAAASTTTTTPWEGGGGGGGGTGTGGDSLMLDYDINNHDCIKQQQLMTSTTNGYNYSFNLFSDDPSTIVAVPATAAAAAATNSTSGGGGNHKSQHRPIFY